MAHTQPAAVYVDPAEMDRSFARPEVSALIKDGYTLVTFLMIEDGKERKLAAIFSPPTGLPPQLRWAVGLISFMQIAIFALLAYGLGA